MERFEQASSIIRILKQRGYEAYFVGGSVRDYLINRPIGDIDIATSALPDEVMKIFPRHVPVGLEHGTVIVLDEDVAYEVTTFRTESGYEDFRRPSEVAFVRSLTEDLQRRDFTMNAIAMTEEGEILDPFGGRRAIQNKQIETVGNPHERFQEDALRMMRGVRFVSVLGFTLSEATKQAIAEHAPLLRHIAIERIAAEFEKLLLGRYVQQALPLLKETKLYEYLPYLEKKQNELIQASVYEWAYVTTDTEAWALLLYIVKINDAETVLRSWKLSNKKIKSITAVLNFLKKRHMQDWDELLLYEAGEEIAVMAETLYAILNCKHVHTQRVKKQYQSLPIHNRKQLQVTGTDLLQWTEKKGGPWVAALLEEIERAVLYRKTANSRESIKEWLNTCKLL
ncbi:CCA tRNA nucleotidyltransferase [Ectobacillus panaciterrae]|uniref:CCA tRNA nucleotidyltransferase n=1 Tax=Ectobacillus panaciterrae TaxID=363872 RepID=UPI0004164783|nr:CCA tRNA nucleotidyltransferase [Ectobacillus panaciterrae]